MKLVALALLISSFFSTALAAQEQPFLIETAPPINETLDKATVSLYLGKQICKYEVEDTMFGPISSWGCKFVSRFVCTGTIIRNNGDGYYTALSAGHCIDWNNEDNYYVAETVEKEPVMHSVKIVKAENDDRYDFAVFTFHSLRNFPAIPVNKTLIVPELGTPVLNVNFSRGVGKQYLKGEVVSRELNEDKLDGARRRFFVSIGVGPGASGSAVVNAQTGEIVGLVEFIFPATQMPAGVIPTGKTFFDFCDDDSAGLKPLKQPAPAKENPPPKEDSKLVKFFKFIRYVFLGF